MRHLSWTVLITLVFLEVRARTPDMRHYLVLFYYSGFSGSVLDTRHASLSCTVLLLWFFWKRARHQTCVTILYCSITLGFLEAGYDTRHAKSLSFVLFYYSWVFWKAGLDTRHASLSWTVLLLWVFWKRARHRTCVTILDCSITLGFLEAG
ncbi:hypothetical protein RRG08_005365 [Elysia crispata]|uniref:Uncharacterized protein n=1 Tax=Elysia crispata TaxID=231223 RepID=A0AAE1ATX3_9GAST|nr:hypothetical protein RRG08_005365 [Elysia crispata]